MDEDLDLLLGLVIIRFGSIISAFRSLSKLGTWRLLALMNQLEI